MPSAVTGWIFTEVPKCHDTTDFDSTQPNVWELQNWGLNYNDH